MSWPRGSWAPRACAIRKCSSASTISASCEMDEAGIDMQILSHGAPSAQKLTGADAVDLAPRVNDRLKAVVAVNPTRFAAFAALPTSDPKAAADELERTTE